jgi:DNA processing protein
VSGRIVRTGISHRHLLDIFADTRYGEQKDTYRLAGRPLRLTTPSNSARLGMPTPAATIRATDLSAHLFERLQLMAVPGLGPQLRRRLLDRFTSAAAVLEANELDLRAVHGIGRQLATAITTASQTGFAEQVLAQCDRHGISILQDGDPDYPRLLTTIDDPPDMLFVRGQLQASDGISLAIVGARHATAAGRRIAEQFAGGLTRAGCTVVSGLARGIDAAAHRGALAAGGRTVAVLGSGLLEVYPPEHRELAHEVAANGAVLSELPPFTPPQASAFPRRNRIVSGLSLGTVVVQASARSGAMITARLAAEQGREVFAVPGPIDCRVTAGCHRLIRDGVTLVTNVDEILEELGPLFEKVTDAAGHEVRHPAELQLDDIQRQVLTAIDRAADDGQGSDRGSDIDTIMMDTNLESSQVLATLAALEIRHLIRRIPGNRVTRLHG